MSAKSKIPPDLEGELLTRAGRGASGDELAVWLLAEHRVEVSGRRVRAFLEKNRREREPIARAVVVEQVSKTVTADLAALEELAREAASIRAKALAGVPSKTIKVPGEPDQKVPGVAPDLNVAIRAINSERAVRETRLRLGGGDPGAGGGAHPGGPAVPTAFILLPPERPIPAPAAGDEGKS